jgi:hypothetical protein
MGLMSMTGKSAVVAGVALVALMSSACAGQSLEFAIEQALATSPQGANFADVVRGDWDRICIVRPYVPAGQIESLLGVRWSGARDTGIDRNDDATLLVFARDSSVVEHVMYPRRKGDFGTPGPEQWYCRARADAVFQLRQPIDGSIPWIGPVGPPR